MNDRFEEKRELKSLSLMKNEHQSVQFLIYESDESVCTRLISKIKVVSELADCLEIRIIEQVYVAMPVGKGCGDDNYISKEP